MGWLRGLWGLGILGVSVSERFRNLLGYYPKCHALLFYSLMRAKKMLLFKETDTHATIPRE